MWRRSIRYARTRRQRGERRRASFGVVSGTTAAPPGGSYTSRWARQAGAAGKENNNAFPGCRQDGERGQLRRTTSSVLCPRRRSFEARADTDGVQPDSSEHPARRVQHVTGCSFRPSQTAGRPPPPGPMVPRTNDGYHVQPLCSVAGTTSILLPLGERRR
jgi:hypothetical protein